MQELPHLLVDSEPSRPNTKKRRFKRRFLYTSANLHIPSSLSFCTMPRAERKSFFGNKIYGCRVQNDLHIRRAQRDSSFVLMVLLHAYGEVLYVYLIRPSDKRKEFLSFAEIAFVMRFSHCTVMIDSIFGFFAPFFWI